MSHSGPIPELEEFVVQEQTQQHSKGPTPLTHFPPGLFDQIFVSWLIPACLQFSALLGIEKSSQLARRADLMKGKGGPGGHLATLVWREGGIKELPSMWLPPFLNFI